MSSKCPNLKNWMCLLNKRVVKVFFLFCMYVFCFFRADAVLQHIAELNPYVHVTSSSIPLNETTDLSFLDKYQVSTPFYIRCHWQIPRLKVGLKLNIQKTKIMVSGPLTSWQIDGEPVETVSDFIFGGSKITTDGDYSHEIKRRLLLGRKVMTNLDSILKADTLLCQQRSV